MRSVPSVFAVLFALLAGPVFAQGNSPDKDELSRQAEILNIQGRLKALEEKYISITNEAIKSGALAERVNTWSNNPASAIDAFAASMRKVRDMNPSFMISASIGWSLADTTGVKGVWGYGAYLTAKLDFFRRNPGVMRATYTIVKEPLVALFRENGAPFLNVLPALTKPFDPAIGEMASTKGLRCRGDYERRYSELDCREVGRIIGTYYGVEKPHYNLVWAVAQLNRDYVVGGIHAVETFQDLAADVILTSGLTK
jgi:hypothetical protein